MDEAIRDCAAGVGIWAGASTDVVMACTGEVPTPETLAAVDLLRKPSRT